MDSLIVLKNGRVLDPAAGRDEIADLWIEDGRIIVPDSRPIAEQNCIDVSGFWVVPGLIDMHVHLREPGEEYKETIATGTAAAAAGGFTAVACMPNTKPVNDGSAVTRLIKEKSISASAHVYPVGAISKNSDGVELAEYGEMKAHGVAAVSDDGLPVMSAQLMRRALEYAHSHGLPVITHAEDAALSKNGCMHEGVVSTRLGLPGIPAAAEAVMVCRDIALAALTGAHLHIAHVSTAASIAHLRQAKQEGVPVSAETAPHYFTLTDEAVADYDTNAKMNPPLRSEADRQEIRRALSDGTLDVIATDHAPHSVLEKECEFELAANGIIGLESAVSLGLALVRDKVINETRLIELMSVNPARILGVPGGSLAAGKQADVTVIDPHHHFILTEDTLVSKSANSPFLHQPLTGRAVLTICAGRITHKLPQSVKG
jgi:dihydroorotase